MTFSQGKKIRVNGTTVGGTPNNAVGVSDGPASRRFTETVGTIGGLDGGNVGPW